MYCVIIGFSYTERKVKYVWDYAPGETALLGGAAGETAARRSTLPNRRYMPVCFRFLDFPSGRGGILKCWHKACWRGRFGDGFGFAHDFRGDF